MLTMQEDALIIAELLSGRAMDFVLGEVYAMQGGTLCAGWQMLSRCAGIGNNAEFLRGYEYRRQIQAEIERAMKLETGHIKIAQGGGKPNACTA